MKPTRLIVPAAFAFAVLGAANVSADHASQKRFDRDKDNHTYEHRHDHKQDKKGSKYRNKHGRHDKRGKHGAHRTVRVDLPVFVDGSRRIKLDRLVYRHHGIDPARYTLKRVIVHNRHAYPHSRARVKIGGRSSGSLFLTEGRNRIDVAPAYGSWSLRVKHAHVRGVTLVLEPKRYRHAGRHDRPWIARDRDHHADWRYRHDRPWYFDIGWSGHR